MFNIPLPAWLAGVHHDGSPKYLSNLYPALGETVTVRLRLPAQAPVQRVFLRTFPDGEQAITAMQPTGSDGTAHWWQADLPITQPLVNYRFLLQAGDGAWWYTAAGPRCSEPLDFTDFKILADYIPPAWVFDSVFYQVFPDRFANGDPANDPRPDEYEYRGQRPQTYPWGQPHDPSQPFPLVFYGGDLQGIAQRLDYIQSLGANALYLNPVFSAQSNHKYDVTDYNHVDAHFGGDAALAALRGELTRRGMRYILDIVPNHCGVDHAWFQRARQDPTAPEADFFTFRQRPDDYATWLGVWSLPKLNYLSRELRQRIYEGGDAVFRRWLREPFRADGWRVDVANMLGRQGAAQLNAEIHRGMRAAVKETRPDAYLIGENFFDASQQLQGDMLDGVMNYTGLTRPLWHWLSGYRQGAIGLPDEITSPNPWPTAALAATWQECLASVPWAVARQQYNLLGSHDTGRILSRLDGNRALNHLAATMLLTFPGVPQVYYGDEIGMRDDSQLGSRGCMQWDEAAWDNETLETYRSLIALRRSHPALINGGFEVLAVEEDFLACQREAPEGRLLVTAQRGAQPRPAGVLDAALHGIPDGTCFVEHFSGEKAVVQAGSLGLPEMPRGAGVWVEQRG